MACTRAFSRLEQRVDARCEELELAERLGKLNKHDLRKYMGFLRNHRLVKT